MALSIIINAHVWGALTDECHPEYGDEDMGPHLGRITGSSSIETLVRVGLEKEAGEIDNIAFFQTKYLLHSGHHRCYLALIRMRNLADWNFMFIFRLITRESPCSFT